MLESTLNQLVVELQDIAYKIGSEDAGDDRASDKLHQRQAALQLELSRRLGPINWRMRYKYPYVPTGDSR
jgi:hypothetical protein